MNKINCVLIIFLLTVFTGASAQNVKLKDTSFIGKYRIIYFSDTNAFSNVVSVNKIDKQKYLNCDSCCILKITDTGFVFDISYSYDNISYEFCGKKAKLTPSHICYRHIFPGISSTPTFLHRFYAIRLKRIADNAIVIYFKNEKNKDLNIMNPSSVKNEKANPEYYEENFKDVFVIAIRY